MQVESRHFKIKGCSIIICSETVSPHLVALQEAFYRGDADCNLIPSFVEGIYEVGHAAKHVGKQAHPNQHDADAVNSLYDVFSLHVPIPELQQVPNNIVERGWNCCVMK